MQEFHQLFDKLGFSWIAERENSPELWNNFHHLDEQEKREKILSFIFHLRLDVPDIQLICCLGPNVTGLMNYLSNGLLNQFTTPAETQTAARKLEIMFVNLSLDTSYVAANWWGLHYLRNKFREDGTARDGPCPFNQNQTICGCWGTPTTMKNLLITSVDVEKILKWQVGKVCLPVTWDLTAYDGEEMYEEQIVPPAQDAPAVGNAQVDVPIENDNPQQVADPPVQANGFLGKPVAGVLESSAEPVARDDLPLFAELMTIFLEAKELCSKIPPTSANVASPSNPVPVVTLGDEPSATSIIVDSVSISNQVSVITISDDEDSEYEERYSVYSSDSVVLIDEETDASSDGEVDRQVNADILHHENAKQIEPIVEVRMDHDPVVNIHEFGSCLIDGSLIECSQEEVVVCDDETDQQNLGRESCQDVVTEAGESDIVSTSRRSTAESDGCAPEDLFQTVKAAMNYNRSLTDGGSSSNDGAVLKDVLGQEDVSSEISGGDIESYASFVDVGVQMNIEKRSNNQSVHADQQNTVDSRKDKNITTTMENEKRERLTMDGFEQSGIKEKEDLSEGSSSLGEQNISSIVSELFIPDDADSLGQTHTTGQEHDRMVIESNEQSHNGKASTVYDDIISEELRSGETSDKANIMENTDQSQETVFKRGIHRSGSDHIAPSYEDSVSDDKVDTSENSKLQDSVAEQQQDETIDSEEKEKSLSESIAKEKCQDDVNCSKQNPVDPNSLQLESDIVREESDVPTDHRSLKVRNEGHNAHNMECVQETANRKDYKGDMSEGNLNCTAIRRLQDFLKEQRGNGFLGTVGEEERLEKDHKHLKIGNRDHSTGNSKYLGEPVLRRDDEDGSKMEHPGSYQTHDVSEAADRTKRVNASRKKTISAEDAMRSNVKIILNAAQQRIPILTPSLFGESEMLNVILPANIKLQPGIRNRRNKRKHREEQDGLSPRCTLGMVDDSSQISVEDIIRKRFLSTGLTKTNPTGIGGKIASLRRNESSKESFSKRLPVELVTPVTKKRPMQMDASETPPTKRANKSRFFEEIDDFISNMTLENILEEPNGEQETPVLTGIDRVLQNFLEKRDLGNKE